MASINGGLTREFPISSGVLQGSVLGPLLFLLYIDDLLNELHESGKGVPFADFILSVIAYADDVTVLSLKVNQLQCLLEICEKWASRNCMKFSRDKCFVVVFNSISRKPDRLPHLRLDSFWMKSYYPTQISEVYLGWNITDRVARTKLSEATSHLHSKVPHYRSKPNHRYLELIKNKFNRSRPAFISSAQIKTF